MAQQDRAAAPRRLDEVRERVDALGFGTAAFLRLFLQPFTRRREVSG
jgi:hypothetical protein